eukprot:Phypoly_transcript_10894.p1 GENE.Phypoly_transcript_10894~~Phypoly_transcript_10894.p1  ORF type:complete len:135 (+),score=19.35 Phypoly_transcript_10894:175-579(+)
MSSPAGFVKLDDYIQEIEREVPEQEEEDEQKKKKPSTPSPTHKKKSKRKTPWNQFLISQTDHENLVPSGLNLLPEMFHIPLEASSNTVDLFCIDFPLPLRGYISACFYVEVLTFYPSLLLLRLSQKFSPLTRIS